MAVFTILRRPRPGSVVTCVGAPSRANSEVSAFSPVNRFERSIDVRGLDLRVRRWQWVSLSLYIVDVV